MGKRAVSLTLTAENILWAKGLVAHGGGSLSGVVDRLVSEARTGQRGTALPSRSVVGTIDVAADDPELLNADQKIRELFAASLSRPTIAREATPPYGARPTKRKTRRD
jgi:hypothetical protein